MIILLNHGKHTVVSHEDYPELSKYNWTYHNGYVVRSTSPVNKKRKYLRMHRVIMNAQPGQMIDHINGDKLDNRRSNLRFCTPGQNLMNMTKPISGVSSKYKGVCYSHKKGNKFRAFIKKDGIQLYLGTFACEKEAAEAYNKKAIELFGEFAKLNKL